MARRQAVLDSSSTVESAQELVDAIVAAVDIDRLEEVERLRMALESFGVGAAFTDELRLSGLPSHCNGECWAEMS